MPECNTCGHGQDEHLDGRAYCRVIECECMGFQEVPGTSDETAPFPTRIEFEQNDLQGFGGPRKVTINGQRVMVQEMTIEYADEDWCSVTVRMHGCRVTQKGNEDA